MNAKARGCEPTQLGGNHLARQPADHVQRRAGIVDEQLLS
jgi:hypothetical protein